MLKHIVMLKFKDFADAHTKEENIERVRQVFSTLPPIIPEIKKMEFGKNMSTIDKSYDAVLYTEFEDQEAFSRYLNNHDHVAASEFIAKLRKERIIVDYLQ